MNKVIIYKRDKGKNINEVYLGNFVQLLPSNEKEYENRSVVEFDSMKYLGGTDSNWNEFTSSKRGAALPVRYIR